MEFKIKEARERMGMSQKDLAAALNIKPTTFNGYETGAHDPKSSVLAEIAKVCNTSVDFLLGLENDSVPSQTKKIPVPAKPETGNQHDREVESFRKALVNIGLIREGQNITPTQARIALSAFQILETVFSEAEAGEEAEETRGAG